MFKRNRNLLVLWVLCGFMGSCQSKREEKPEDNRFTRVVLAQDLDEPMQFKVLKDGRVLFVERKGKIKIYDPATKRVDVIADIPVSVGYYSLTGEVLEPTGEDGMQGVALDPDFDRNRWIYLYYSPKGGDPKTILTRYEWPKGKVIDTASKKVLLEVPNQRESCCHLGGGMIFDAAANLYLSTGDNTPNDPRGFSPLDARPGRSRYDSRRSAGNTNDFRGKILRIHPEPDGSYSIPADNLFPKGTPKTRPEIYTMGNRNPWRLSIDSKTGWLYWGEVGPTGITDSVGMGPRSYDEFNRASRAGNFGWPFFLANNKVYWDYDYATGKSGNPFDSGHPVNSSPNNTGLADLPPAVPALIWYPQSKAVDFPLMGSGSNSAVGGPVFRRADFTDPGFPFPAYYEGKWFITDWIRGWILVVTFDKEGAFKSMERFLPDLTLEGPIDMSFGPEGDLYILEYGRGTYKRNGAARLVKIEYNEGNRKPVVQIAADKTAGSVPLTVQLSSSGTKDYDNDTLTYEWEILSPGKASQRFTAANPVATFSQEGLYEVTLKVTDSKGAESDKTIKIVAGNAPPDISFDFQGANRSFYFPGKPINYSVAVRDKEDGSLADKGISSKGIAPQGINPKGIDPKGISPSAVSVSIDYLAVGEDFAEVMQKLQHADSLVPIQSILANQLIAANDCASCHSVTTKLLGPAFNDIAKKYEKNEDAQKQLADKVRSGGSGVWGEMTMPPHPEISKDDINTIVKYILSLASETTLKSRPVEGTYVPVIPAGERGDGKIIFKASYIDRGNGKAPRQSSTALVVLRNPVVPVSQADRSEGLVWNYQIDPNKSSAIFEKQGAYLGFNQVDLANIKWIECLISKGSKEDVPLTGKLQVRLDAPTGKIIGQTAERVIVKDPHGNDMPLIRADIEPVSGIHDLYFVFSKTGGGTEIEKLPINAVRFSDQ